MKALVSIFFSIIIVLVTNGCVSREIHEKDLVGRYLAELPDDARETLELNLHGKSHQEIRLKDGTTYKADGTWRYNEKLKYLYLEGTRIALAPDRKISSTIEQIPAGNTGALSVSRTLLGNVSIMLYEDIDYQRR